MGLDYSQGCVNFRDVGECLNLLADRTIFPLGRLLRGGKLDFVTDAESIGKPASIINLRKGPDPEHLRFGADSWHFPISNDHEKYETTDRVVKRWLNDIVSCLAGDPVQLPVLFHCTSGKDRTGVAIAAVLTICGIDREWIVREYLWSEGEVRREWIEGALDGIDDPETYFHRVDLARLRNRFLDLPTR